MSTLLSAVYAGCGSLEVFCFDIHCLVYIKCDHQSKFIPWTEFSKHKCSKKRSIQRQIFHFLFAGVEKFNTHPLTSNIKVKFGFSLTSRDFDSVWKSLIWCLKSPQPKMVVNMFIFQRCACFRRWVGVSRNECARTCILDFLMNLLRGN